MCSISAPIAFSYEFPSFPRSWYPPFSTFFSLSAIIFVFILCHSSDLSFIALILYLTPPLFLESLWARCSDVQELENPHGYAGKGKKCRGRGGRSSSRLAAFYLFLMSYRWPPFSTALRGHPALIALTQASLSRTLVVWTCNDYLPFLSYITFRAPNIGSKDVPVFDSPLVRLSTPPWHPLSQLRSNFQLST